MYQPRPLFQSGSHWPHWQVLGGRATMQPSSSPTVLSVFRRLQPRDLVSAPLLPPGSLSPHTGSHVNVFSLDGPPSLSTSRPVGCLLDAFPPHPLDVLCVFRPVCNSSLVCVSLFSLCPPHWRLSSREAPPVWAPFCLRCPRESILPSWVLAASLPDARLWRMSSLSVFPVPPTYPLKH